jgi:thiamine-phosphate pyrophosphorylase
MPSWFAASVAAWEGTANRLRCGRLGTIRFTVYALLMEAPSSDGEPTSPEKPIGRLHVLTDYHLQQDFHHAELARLAIRGGADTIQFRQKHGGIQNQLIEARKVASVCSDATTPLIIDDRIDIAQAVGADGTHLGQEDFPIDAARSVLGSETIIGATATKSHQVVAAYEMGADYIGFGPVFPTTSKRNPKSVKGPEGLADACESVPIPVIAIGGITHDRVRRALEAGAHGVAVLSAVATANNPQQATARFRAAIDGVLRESE